MSAISNDRIRELLEAVAYLALQWDRGEDWRDHRNDVLALIGAADKVRESTAAPQPARDALRDLVARYDDAVDVGRRGAARRGMPVPEFIVPGPSVSEKLAAALAEARAVIAEGGDRG